MCGKCVVSNFLTLKYLAKRSISLKFFEGAVFDVNHHESDTNTSAHAHHAHAPYAA